MCVAGRLVVPPYLRMENSIVQKNDSSNRARALTQTGSRLYPPIEAFVHLFILIQRFFVVITAYLLNEAEERDMSE